MGALDDFKDAVKEANGTLEDGTYRGGVINNSFGTNIRYNAKGDSLPVNNIKDSEFEYFLFKKNPNANGKDFVDAAWDAVKGKNVVQIITTGNRNMSNPFYRPLYPYFNPEAENQWIAVTGLRKSGYDANDNYKFDIWTGVNKGGDGKWWTVAAPGAGIYSSIVYDDHYVPSDKNHPLGSEGYQSFSGTSMAAPHVAGAMGVLMERYSDMTAPQVRQVMFTTANHKNFDGSNYNHWSVGEGQVDPLFGWGVPDLAKGMFGPGQFVDNFSYQLGAGKLDVWSNDISQVALEQRKSEEKQWLDDVKYCLKADGKTVDASLISLKDAILYRGDIPGLEKDKITEDEARKWLAEYYQKRLDSVLERQNLDGSLTKRGGGTLVMTGSNTYVGGTVVESGTLLGFTESFGTKVVEVNGGTFGLLEKYNDTFTKKGMLTSNEDRLANINVNNGGTLQITAGHDVKAGTVTFKEGSTITVSASDLKSVYNGKAESATFEAVTVNGLDLVTLDNSLAFFKTTLDKVDANRAASTVLEATIARDESVTMSSFAKTDNGRSIGAVLEAAGQGAVFDAVLGGTRDQVHATYASLGSDAFLNAQNASVVNTLTMTRTIQDQAQGIGEGRSIDFADGTGRLWATGVGSWGTVDYGQTSIDNDFYAGFIGAEVTVHPTTKVGVFFGAGNSKFKGGQYGKIESDDVHVGLYGASNVADVVGFNYGVTFTKQDRDQSRTLAFGTQTGANATTGNVDILQVFAEVAYTGFNTASYSVEPYVGFSWINVKSDDFSETVGTTTFKTINEDQDIQVATLGVRGAIPFAVGGTQVAVKANAGWSHFFGDTEATATMNLGGSGLATIKGGELKDQAIVGLGVEAKLTQSATFGLSYTGTYDGDVTSNGVTANLRFAF